MKTIDQRGWVADAIEQIAEQYDPSPANIARTAMNPLILWLEYDAEEELAAQILAERPGDTDISAAREQVREVIGELLVVIYREYGVPG